MKNSYRNQYSFIPLIFAAIAIFGLNANNVYATETEGSEGFCDCSTAGELICHIPQGNPESMHTIQVGGNAIHAHLAHGDEMGMCPEDTNSNTSVEEQPPCVCSDGSVGVLYHASPSSIDRSQRSIFGQ